MSTQLTVRLADHLVEFIDQRIRDGQATSRAAVIGAAVERERRRQIAERDAEILTRSAGRDDLDALASFSVRVRMEDLD